MKILYVLNSNVLGGMEKHVEDLVRGMIDYDHDVYVWCLKGPISEVYESYGAHVYTNSKIKSDIDIAYIKELSRFLREKRIDVVHAHELKAVVNALIAGTIAKTPVKISHTHTPISEWQSPKLSKRIIWFFTTVFYSFIVNVFSDAEIALTQSRKKVKMIEGMLDSKLEVIPNSLDISQFIVPAKTSTLYRKQILKKHELPEDAFIFGNIGRITQEKGIDVAIKAFAEFLKHPLNTNKPFYLMLVGGGTMQSYLKDLISELKIEDNVIITGVFEEEDKVKYYSSLDVFLFPTLAEGFGLVLMEAMVSELPVISSDLPVLEEVAEDTVTYFEKGNYLDLATKMDLVHKQVIDDTYNTVRAKDLILNKYSMDKFVKSYVNLYTRLMVK